MDDERSTEQTDNTNPVEVEKTQRMPLDPYTLRVFSPPALHLYPGRVPFSCSQRFTLQLLSVLPCHRFIE